MESELAMPIWVSQSSAMDGFPNHQSSYIWANPYTQTLSGLPMLQSESPGISSLQQLCDVDNRLSASVPQDGGADSGALQAVLSGGFANYGLEPDQLGESMVTDDWMPQNYMNLSSNASNELSLRLSAYSGIQNQCSDMSCSEQNPSCDSANGKQSVSSGLDRKGSQLSQIMSQPRYLGVVQEILSQFASFSLENMDQQLTPSYLDHCAEQGDSFKGSDDSPVESSSHQRPRNQAMRSQLLALLQMLDDCYNQCLDETHTVISAFHAATELDPHRHACFALRRVSVLYKSLKERISKQILKMGACDDGGSGSDGGGASGSCSRDQLERSFEKSFIQKQWALQQLKRKDQQLWRPQRGLPERSVSVLRGWMFQNFLHPYPKDAEKHLLAIKSGLTRSQVSNWFINARVRLWKPLIEEMYSELNRSRAGNGHQGNDERITYNCPSIRNSRYSMS